CIEIAGGRDRALTYRQGANRGAVGVRVPTCSCSESGIECGNMVAPLVADIREIAARIECVPAQRQGMNSQVRRRPNIAGSGSDGIERCDVVATPPANAYKVAPRIDRV